MLEGDRRAMTGPLDESLDRAHHNCCRNGDEACLTRFSPSDDSGTIRRHSRRGVLGLFLGAAEFVAVERHSAFADDSTIDATSTTAPEAATDAPADGAA